MKSATKYYDQDDLVIEKNALIHSRQTFTLLQRILALAIAQINRDDRGNKIYEIRIKDLTDLSNSDNIYNQLEAETRDLAGKVITLKEIDDQGLKSFSHWAVISMAKHKEKSGVLKIRFDPDIREMLFQLKGNWTATVAMELASCRSSYGPSTSVRPSRPCRFVQPRIWAATACNLRTIRRPLTAKSAASRARDR
jgi:plasmid replication initiation protein